MPSCQPGCTCGRHNGRTFVSREESLRAARENSREWRKAHPEKQREYDRAAKERDPEKVRYKSRYKPEVKARYREKNREKIRAWNRDYRNAKRGNHRLKPGEFEAIWEAQGGLCCYCRQPLPREPKRVHLDHDHTCCPPGYSCQFCRRGLACNNCNVIVGMAGEDWDRLVAIAVNGRDLAAKVRERIEDKPVQGELLPNVVEFKREAG